MPAPARDRSPNPAPAANPRPPPASAEPKLDANHLWRSVVADLKTQRRDLLAMALAHGRVLEVTSGQVRLGFGPEDGMFRSQAERGVKDAEAALARVLGAPTRLTFESISADDAKRSVAQEDSARERAREERAQREGREHPAVLAAMRILGGTVEHIRVLESEGDAPFTGASDAGEEPEAEEPEA